VNQPPDITGPHYYPDWFVILVSTAGLYFMLRFQFSWLPSSLPSMPVVSLYYHFLDPPDESGWRETGDASPHKKDLCIRCWQQLAQHSVS